MPSCHAGSSRILDAHLHGCHVTGAPLLWSMAKSVFLKGSSLCSPLCSPYGNPGDKLFLTCRGLVGPVGLVIRVACSDAKVGRDPASSCPVILLSHRSCGSPESRGEESSDAGSLSSSSGSASTVASMADVELPLGLTEQETWVLVPEDIQEVLRILGSAGARLVDADFLQDFRLDGTCPLGQGCQALVLLAERKDTKNPLWQEVGGRAALKMPLGLLKSGPEGAKNAEALRREVTALAALQGHPNIVRLYCLIRLRCDSEMDGQSGRFYMTATLLECCGGGSLEQLLKNGALIESSAKRVVCGVLEGLRHMHGLGFLHRDVKPENVLFRRTGEVVLVDFGLAAGIDDEAMALRPGTAGYTAPEVISGEAHSRPSDLFSTGCLLYKALYGRPAFPGTSQESTLRRNLRCMPFFTKDISEEALNLVTWLLQPQPVCRPSSASQALAHAWLCWGNLPFGC